jgi:tetratricopeptide (TPR) repeat protein
MGASKIEEMLRPCILAVLLALPLAAQPQDNSAPPQASPPPSSSQKKSDAQKKPSEGQQNPFPEAQSAAAARGAQENDAAPAAPQPDAPQPAAGTPTSKPATADQNPFPEARSEKAAHQAREQENRSASAPAAAEPGDQDYSSSRIHLKGFDPSNSGSAAGGGGTVLSPQLGREDTKVGMFYLHTGDFKGAYNRFAEATRVDPGNADAVFGLAEAARHLNLRDQALRNYQLYLSALPNGPRTKEIRKALKDMGASPQS